MRKKKISIKEAEAAGITKLRLPHWTNTEDHLEFTVLRDSGGFGPWVNLWSPTNSIVGAPNPQKFIITQIGDVNAKDWLPYEPATP